MTSAAQVAAIMQACGVAPQWVLMKRGLYYRPKAAGYTSSLAEAGRYSEAEAKQHVYPHDEPVTMHTAPLPDYLGDLNVMHEVEKTLDGAQFRVYTRHLMTVVLAYPVIATAAERAKAFILTVGKWDDSL